MPANVIAKNIRKIRNAKDISQEELAKTLNVTRQAISKWENGKTQPDIDTLMAISKAFDIDLTELIYGYKTTEEHLNNKKNAIKHSIILAAVFTVLLIFGCSQSYLQQLRMRDLGGIWYLLMLLNIFLTFPALYSVGGALFLSILSIWKDITINSKARKYLLFLGAAIIWSYLIFTSVFYISLNYEMGLVIQLIAVWLIANNGIFIIPGLCIFLGINGEKAESRKSILIVLSITLCLFIITAFIIIGPFISHWIS